MRKALETGQKTTRIDREIVPILGVPVDSTTKRRVLRFLEDFLSSPSGRRSKNAFQAQNGREAKLFVTTPNPEIVNLALKEPLFRQVLGHAHLNLPDGIGIIMAQRFLKMQVPKFPVVTQLAILCIGIWVGISAVINRKWLFASGETVPGRLIFEDLVKLAEKNRWKIFLLGGKLGVAGKAVRKLLGENGELQVDFSEGPLLGMDGSPRDSGQAQIERETIAKINAFSPDILFVGFGAPKQEYWLKRNLPRLHTRVGMVVGGTFDSIAGTVISAPRWITESGFEWGWRLVTQPWRLPRIFNAVIVFPLKVFTWRLKND